MIFMPRAKQLIEQKRNEKEENENQVIELKNEFSAGNVNSFTLEYF